MTRGGCCIGQLNICVMVSWLWLMITTMTQAQNTTHPAEVRVINTLFSGWRIPQSLVTQMGWNLSGEPCSGAAVDTSIDINDGAYNPSIKCDCSFPNSTCHITRLKIYALDVVGPIPEELWTLTYLTNLNVAQNYLTGSLSPSVGNLTRMQFMTIGINALSGEVPSELGLLTDLRALLQELLENSCDRRWGVSNVGQRDNPLYIATTSFQFTNTLESQLFQTARTSAGSLRYYGLRLENGNYTVNLQFAEIQIGDGTTWRSPGRRVFDIYLQGNLAFPDFDIKRTAGGGSNIPVSHEVTVMVSDNYLEIHLLWSGKGTCCIPNRGTYGPLLSAINATLSTQIS